MKRKPLLIIIPLLIAIIASAVLFFTDADGFVFVIAAKIQKS